jgi:predicted chitinase
MLISPPFLPPRGAQQSDAQWLDSAMLPSDTGVFPVSHKLGWHGGRHIQAPMGGNGVALPVRAIADGTVVFVRERSEAGAPEHPLNYGGGYTSDAVVVIRHDTEIGADAQGEAVKVTFYSLYMHLHSVRRTVQRGRPICRKDEIGQAGHIYGRPNCIHFEVCCDDANIARLVGRGGGDLNISRDGRSDALFGQLYFVLPAGAHVYGQQPIASSPQAMMQPTAPHGQPRPAPVALQPVHITRADLIVGIDYAAGQGVAGQRGDALVTTYHPDGTIEGSALREAEAEYGLYAAATAISNAYPAASRPAPSAVYELLRFGRVIGPDALNPSDVPHWRAISYPGGRGWVNLNASNVRKFSDADFPQWRGWSLVSDDTSGDSRCGSPHIKSIVYGSGADRVEPTAAHAATQLGNEAVRARLSKTICKFPSEWDSSTLDARWNWLKANTKENPEPMNGEDYARFKAHATALCFGLPELFAAQWCFEPRVFVELFRLCGWMSPTELGRVLGAAPAAGRGRANELRLSMNKMMRKYGVGVSRLRTAHFLAQVGHETGWWQYREELGNERYFRTMYEAITPQEAAEDFRSGLARRLNLVARNESETGYAARRPVAVAAKARGMDNGVVSASAGGEPGDGPRFRGRGFLQITGRRNYAGYGNYRGRDFITDPNPRLLSSDDFNACDASGFYWSRERANSEADGGSEASVATRVGGIVNRGRPGSVPLHDVERQAAFAAIWRVLSETN